MVQLELIQTIDNAVFFPASSKKDDDRINSFVHSVSSLVCVCACVWVRAYVHACMYICVHVCVCMHVCVCVHARVCVCVVYV